MEKYLIAIKLSEHKITNEISRGRKSHYNMDDCGLFWDPITPNMNVEYFFELHHEVKKIKTPEIREGGGGAGLGPPLGGGGGGPGQPPYPLHMGIPGVTTHFSGLKSNDQSENTGTLPASFFLRPQMGGGGGILSKFPYKKSW